MCLCAFPDDRRRMSRIDQPSHSRPSAILNEVVLPAALMPPTTSTIVRARMRPPRMVLPPIAAARYVDRTSSGNVAPVPDGGVIRLGRSGPCLLSAEIRQTIVRPRRGKSRARVALTSDVRTTCTYLIYFCLLDRAARSRFSTHLQSREAAEDTVGDYELQPHACDHSYSRSSSV